MPTITLAHHTDFASLRMQARELLLRGVVPGEVSWQVQQQAQQGLFDSGQAECAEAGSDCAVTLPSRREVLRIPKSLFVLCQALILHSAPERLPLIYTLLWRCVQTPSFLFDSLDAEMLRAQRMVKQVRRDMHKTKAFVRFRPVQVPGDTPDAPPWHLAWFEPLHHTTLAVAPFFIQRFANMCWGILTPHVCIYWDGRALHQRAGASREDAPAADAAEALWLTYYASTFNPARLKLNAMRKELPVAYWRNLPEAQLITPLAQQADSRMQAMIARSRARSSQPIDGD